eukprot:1407068-Pleurochrysis_carterae.AAC.1
MSAAGAAFLKTVRPRGVSRELLLVRAHDHRDQRADPRVLQGDAPVGDYAKGKGRREFVPWLKANHGGALYIPLERADGGRHDLDFNGTLPIYINRKFM